MSDDRDLFAYSSTRQIAVIPTTALLLFRVGVEERALQVQFGDEYARYRNETSRLFPSIY